MPNVFGRDVQSVEEIIEAFQRHGDAVRGRYRVRYTWSRSSQAGYAPPVVERPGSLAGNPPGVVFPWEQVLTAAAACAGSDLPMLFAHRGLPLTRAELLVECVFDPRGEFDGLMGWSAPADAKGCFLSLHLTTTVVTSATREDVEEIHRRVVDRNMVLGALRGIPKTDALVVNAESKSATGTAAPEEVSA